MLVKSVGTKALMLVIAEDGTTPVRTCVQSQYDVKIARRSRHTWYCNRALSRPVSAPRAARVALPTFANASLDGARMVMFVAEPSAVTTLGTRASTPASEESSAVEFRACARVGVCCAKVWPARARTESCLICMLNTA